MSQVEFFFVCFFANRQQQRPLTRYLPIRGDGFDLRQHVETAGHQVNLRRFSFVCFFQPYEESFFFVMPQVELCGHVTLTSTSSRGYLHKMGSRFRTWNKRWFVFDRTTRTLVNYSDKS